MKIRKFPDPVLRTKTAMVGPIGSEERHLLDEMAKTMYMSQGVGLAATQVGLKTQLAVINVGTGLIKMINPAIVKSEGRIVQEEGCLSVPGTTVNVKRARKVIVQYMNENGDVCELKADGLLARAIQHEIDHLNGVMIIDYLNPIKRAFAKRRIARTSTSSVKNT